MLVLSLFPLELNGTDDFPSKSDESNDDDNGSSLTFSQKKKIEIPIYISISKYNNIKKQKIPTAARDSIVGQACLMALH